MKNKYLQLVFNTGIFAIGNFLVKLIQFFLLPLYTSIMSSEEYGTAELLNNFSEIMFPVITLAIYESVFRFSIDNEENRDTVLYEGTLLITKRFILLFLFIIVIQFFIHYPYTYYILFVLFSYSLRMFFANFARGSGYAKCFSLSGIADALSLSFFSWLYLVHFKLGVKGYLAALGCAHIVSIITLLSGAQIIRRIMKRKSDKELLKNMLHYSLPLIANNIAFLVTSMTGRYFVFFMYGSGIAGLYTAANKLPAVISMMSQIFQQSWQLSSVQEYQSEDYTDFLENVLKVYSIGMFVFGAAAICAIPVLAKITLKKEFYGARIYISPMMLAVLIQCMSIYFGAILIALKKTKDIMYGMILGGIVNIVISGLLIKKIGIWSVLIAGILCYLSILIHRIWIVNKYIKFSKHFEVSIPLFSILCVQTVIMCFDNTFYTILAVILFFLMIIIVCCSYHLKIECFAARILIGLREIKNMKREKNNLEG